MKNIMNKGLLMLTLFFNYTSSTFADNQYGLKDKIQDGVILHCFDWKLSDIKAEIPNIAKAGFTAVQTSPVHQKEPVGAAWYMPYQPYDFVIGNGIGDANDLKALCDEAHKHGVKVIVDVVANHTNGNLSYVASRLQDRSLYHDYNGGCNDGDRYSVTHAQIGMMDLKTEDLRVQAIIKEYIQNLKACGVDGIRWDAIKHIGLPSEGDSFMTNVVDQTMYNYGEILNTPGPNADQLYKEYTQYMSVTDNTYGNNVTKAFAGGGVSTSTGNLTYRGIAANKLVYWGESHDTYSNDPGDDGWSKHVNQNFIDRSYAIMAGNNDATSLYFSRPSATEKSSIKFGAKGSTHFTAPEVAEANHMHNICAGEPNYCVHTNDLMAQVRKSGVVIALSGGNGNKQVSFANGAGDGKWFKAGTYTDKVGGGKFTVTNTTISGQVGSTGIAVLYVEGNIVKEPNVTFDPADGTSFSDATLSVTATAANATSAWVQVNGGAKQTFTTTKTFSVGADVDYGKNITISWGATGKDENNAEVTKTGSVTYKKVKAYEPVLESADEVSCFLETAESDIKLWIWDDKDDSKKFNNAAWPGDAMELVGKSADGKGIYKWTYTGSTTGLPTNIIFTHGGEKFAGTSDETDKGVAFKNHGYYVETKYTKEITKVNHDDIILPGTDKYVYFDNNKNWENVYCYFYNGNTSSSTWPGVKMTYDTSVSHNGKTGWYMAEIPAGYTNAKFFINDGTAGTAINRGDASTTKVVNDGTEIDIKHAMGTLSKKN